MMGVTWKEHEILMLTKGRKEGAAFADLAQVLGRSRPSVMQKYGKLMKALNDDKYHHCEDKVKQVERILPCLNKKNLRILETHAGWGNLTSHYHKYGEVMAHDIDEARVDFIKSKALPRVHIKKCDSEMELFNYVYNKDKFDLIDLDPYGYPNRMFPHVFRLMKEGVLLVTFPKLGSNFTNNIIERNYRVFWDIDTKKDKDVYIDKIHKAITQYGYMMKKKVEVLESIDLGRVFRLAYQVSEESMFTLADRKNPYA